MRLPPLNPLKAFEATVRLGGFTAAAVELGVSPPAVSMQVRKAEEYFGKRLFLRTHNNLHLTDAGRQLYPSVSTALMDISTITDHMLENEARSNIVISTIQSLAVRWAGPAIARFRKAHPEVGIELKIEADPVDLARTQTDIRLTYESHLYPHLEVSPLFEDVAYPLCTQEFFKNHCADGDLSNIPDSTFIHTDWGESYASFPTWAAWYRAAKIVKNPDVRKGLRVGGTAVSTALAASGAGIALVPKRLFREVRKRDHIVNPTKIGISLPYAFYAITQPQHFEISPQGRPKDRLVKRFLEVLKTNPD